MELSTWSPSKRAFDRIPRNENFRKLKGSQPERIKDQHQDQGPLRLFTGSILPHKKKGPRFNLDERGELRGLKFNSSSYVYMFVRRILLDVFLTS